MSKGRSESLLTVLTSLDDNLHLETYVILSQALATTNWASENGTRDQWRGLRGGTNHLAKRLKYEETGTEQERRKRGERRQRL